MHSIDFTVELKNLDNETITEPIYGDELDANGRPKKTGEEIVTLGKLCRGALMGLTKNEENISGDKKLERYMFAVKIKESEDNDEELELKTDEIAWLKKLIGKKYPPLYVGVSWNLLEKVAEKNDE